MKVLFFTGVGFRPRMKNGTGTTYTAKKTSFIASFIRFRPESVYVMCPQENGSPFPASRSHRLSFVKDKAALVNSPNTLWQY